MSLGESSCKEAVRLLVADASLPVTSCYIDKSQDAALFRDDNSLSYTR